MIGLVGKTLGKYRILARLGRGGTATVYKAFQPGLDRYVAIKVLHGHLAEDEDFIRRFEREASAVARLRHPNIVQVHDFDHIGDLYYMVMEFIEGPSLKEELRARNSPSQAFTLSEIARVFGALGGAIDYAHEQGMVHHDLKPANIMFTAQGQVVLTDFGIAKIVGHSTGTLTGAVFGTPTYMSPEQGQGQRGDERSDIYSLGIILFELVTGQVPFDDDTPYTIINRHISDPLPSPSSLNPDLSPEVERVILKATEKSPDARFQSGRSLAQALYEAVGLSPGQSLVSAPVVPLAQVAELRIVDLDSEFPLYTPSSGLEPPSSTKIDDQEPPTRLLQRRPYVTAGVIVFLLLIGLVGVYGIFGDGVFTFLPATLTPTPQPPVATPTPPDTLMAANIPISAPTATATNTPTVTATPAPTSTATPTPSPPPTATETLTPTPTAVPPPPTPTRIGAKDLYNRILFKTDRAGTVQIYSMNPDGSDQQLADPLIYNQLAALEALSPDGKQQVVVRTEGNAELWLITLDGSQDEWRITYTAEYDYDPAWSPVGDLIAFVSERTGNGDIYISTPLGFAAERITFNEDAYDRHPSWSPDGQYLVFWSNAQFGLRQLYIYDIQTGETRSVGGGPYNDWDPLWVK
jgi:serine/threonine protein kinase